MLGKMWSYTLQFMASTSHKFPIQSMQSTDATKIYRVTFLGESLSLVVCSHNPQVRGGHT